MDEEDQHDMKEGCPVTAPNSGYMVPLRSTQFFASLRSAKTSYSRETLGGSVLGLTHSQKVIEKYSEKENTEEKQMPMYGVEDGRTVQDAPDHSV
ncbi:MAG: hypothetical protein ACOCWM_01890 [Cyclobacteriaceae bacterium]